MALAGDFDEWRVVLDYYENAAILLSQRTQLYFNHSGVWTTETHHLTGAYDQTDYGCGDRAGWPVWLMQSGYLKVDWAGFVSGRASKSLPRSEVGYYKLLLLARPLHSMSICSCFSPFISRCSNSGTGEWAIMALDFYSWTGNAQYLPLAFAAADFLSQHFTNRSADGNVIVWPAQVLESYWCTYDAASERFTDACCADDTPTVSAMLSLFPRLLALPPALTTPAQRAAWEAFAAIMPALPLSPDGGSIVPARVLSNGGHNGEGPELYVSHPHRLLTVGRAVASGGSLNLSAAIRTLLTNPWYANDNTWTYGINDAVLLGQTEFAVTTLLAKAAAVPPPGYRFSGYAPTTGDYDPGLEYYNNMNRALQEMLLQSGDDGYESTTIVLFPAWPCAWDVAFKLWGPLNTTVEVAYAAGKLESLVVTPQSRAASVNWAACVANAE